MHQIEALNQRVPHGAPVMLERSAGKLARSVLRGLGGCEPTWLPGASARGFEMSVVNITIRTATVADAYAIGELAKEFQAYLRALGDRTQFEFTAETYLRDGFGPNPAFSGLVAELDGEVVGYLLYHFGYDTDRAMRLMHVIDLYVQEAKRRRGIGEALMQAVAKRCQEAGGRELVWSVFVPNKLAFQFYERLGAKHIQELKFMYWPVPSL